MLTKKIGFIGAGLMGGALIEGILRKEIVPPENINVFDKNKVRMQDLKNTLKIHTCTTVKELVLNSEIVFLAVKPQDFEQVLLDLQVSIQAEKHLLVSIVTGISMAYMKKYLPTKTPLIRIVPNTPCLVEEGVVAIATTQETTPEDLQIVKDIVNPLGMLVTVEEKDLNAITGLSGSGPGFVYKVIEALADGGVAVGLSKTLALKLASQTVYGSAKMVLTKGKHPAELKDMVTSPGGTTITGILEMEKEKVPYALSRAVILATQKAAELGK